MQKSRNNPPDKDFVAEIQSLEVRLFPGEIDPSDPKRMKNKGRYSWLYRPSHHAATGLITMADIELLKQKDKRLLSVGAHPAYLEQLLCVLGVPAEHIFVGDKDPGIALADGLMDRTIFDATGIWPDIGTFDLIIFPESLCMAVGGDAKRSEDAPEGTFPSDAKEAEALATVLEQALLKLRPEGEIRANGPMSHPNVVKAASKALETKGYKHNIDYHRYFMTVRHKSDGELEKHNS